MSQREPKSYLRDTHPELRTQFVRALDKRNSKFDELSSSSSIRCVWQCTETNCDAKCLHTWEVTVSSRTHFSTGCPFCTGNRICRCNSFGMKCPELLKEYHPENTRSPYTISVGSSFKAKWLCSRSQCGHHVWDEKISQRTSTNKYGCPFCSAHRCCPCYSLQTQFPDIAAEFDLEKNFPLTPDQFTPHSSKNVWWFCKEHNVSWDTTIHNRTTSNAPGCRQCKMTKMEFYMNITLKVLLEKQMILGYEYDKRLPGTLFRADFWVTLTNKRFTIVEMDGEQHFHGVRFSHSTTPEAVFQKTRRRDVAKRAWCEKNHVHLLRISYLIPVSHYEKDMIEYLEWCKTAPANLSAISHIHAHETKIQTATAMDE